MGDGVNIAARLESVCEPGGICLVIARNTAFTYKGKAIDANEIGTELGVRYLLEGSVQRDQNRVRVNAQLVDSESGAHLWAERFEEDIADLFIEIGLTLHLDGAAHGVDHAAKFDEAAVPGARSLRSALSRAKVRSSSAPASRLHGAPSGRTGLGRRLNGYVDAVAGVRRHSIAASATITRVTINSPTGEYLYRLVRRLSGGS
jgi:hypothetical protein